MSEYKSYGEWCDAVPVENEIATGILLSWRGEVGKLLMENNKLEARIAELEAELKELQDDFVSSQNMLGGAVLEIERRANNVHELEAAQRWIPVGERLPEKEDGYLTAYRTKDAIGAVTLRVYVGGGRWFDGNIDYEVSPQNVTHWMPLPVPPEGDA